MIWREGPIQMRSNYQAIVSSDWNECLAPCGPFDFISFNQPAIKAELSVIFRQYSANQIPLSAACNKIRKLMPNPVTSEQMDAYLDKSFATYPGVPDLIEWCLSENILFMINTTGMIGYFQRIFSKGLLPRLPVISAHPMIRYPEQPSDPQYIMELLETGDKAKNSGAAIRSLGITTEKIILMGDSGGDGPHFKWGAKNGAYLIGSMTKPSLDDYCQKMDISINLRFGVDYSADQNNVLQQEIQIDFRKLITKIEEFINR